MHLYVLLKITDFFTDFRPTVSNLTLDFSQKLNNYEKFVFKQLL